MVMFSSDACKAAEKKQKNMRFKEHAMTPEMPFDAKWRTCFSSASENVVKLKRTDA